MACYSLRGLLDTRQIIEAWLSCHSHPLDALCRNRSITETFVLERSFGREIFSSGERERERHSLPGSLPSQRPTDLLTILDLTIRFGLLIHDFATMTGSGSRGKRVSPEGNQHWLVHLWRGESHQSHFDSVLWLHKKKKKNSIVLRVATGPPCNYSAFTYSILCTCSLFFVFSLYIPSKFSLIR